MALKIAAKKTAAKTHDFRQHIVGIDTKVPLLDGRLVSYVNFDNAASTPALREVSPGHLAACHFADQLSLAGLEAYLLS